MFDTCCVDQCCVALLFLSLSILLTVFVRTLIFIWNVYIYIYICGERGEQASERRVREIEWVMSETLAAKQIHAHSHTHTNKEVYKNISLKESVSVMRAHTDPPTQSIGFSTSFIHALKHTHTFSLRKYIHWLRRVYMIWVRMMIAYFRIDTIHIMRACMHAAELVWVCLPVLLSLSYSLTRSLLHIVVCHNYCFHVRKVHTHARTHTYRHTHLDLFYMRPCKLQSNV